MATAELEVIKDIPGYKVILKAILKSQIQQLVEQLAAHTEEESVILTASVNDGTLSHLGSDSGKNFLEDHEDIKSQFLGFCLRKHHKKKQQEKDDKEQQEREEALRNLPTTPTRHHPAGPGPRFSPRSPRFPSPRQPGVYPMAMTRAASGGPIRMRHEPYPRPQKRPLSFDPQQTMGPSSSNQSPRMQQAPGKVIKLEADDSDSDNTTPSAQTSSDFPNQTFSSSQTDSSASGMKREASEKDDDRFSTTSSVSNEASDLNPAEGLGLDSDFSGLIPPSEDSSGADNLNQPGTPSSAPQTPGSSGSGLDSGVNVKVEAITESEMELEITGVELGPGPSPQGWGPGAGPVPQMGGATGSPGDMQQGSYSAKRDIVAQYQEYLQHAEKKSSSLSPQACSTDGETPQGPESNYSKDPSDSHSPNGSSKPSYSPHPSDSAGHSGGSTTKPSSGTLPRDSSRPSAISQSSYSRCPSDSPSPSASFLPSFSPLTSDDPSPSGSGTAQLSYNSYPSTSSKPPADDTPQDMMMKIIATPEYGQVVQQMSQQMSQYFMSAGAGKTRKYPDRVPKDLPCEVCGKIFPANRDLKRHMLVHTKEKPYKCVLCNFSSARRDNLKCHMRNKHEIHSP